MEDIIMKIDKEVIVKSDVLPEGLPVNINLSLKTDPPFVELNNEQRESLLQEVIGELKGIFHLLKT